MGDAGLYVLIASLAVVLAILALLLLRSHSTIKEYKTEKEKVVIEEEEKIVSIMVENSKVVDDLKKELMEKNRQLEEKSLEESPKTAFNEFINVIENLEQYHNVSFLIYDGLSVRDYLIRVFNNEKEIIETIKSDRAERAKKIEINNKLSDIKDKINHICSEMGM